MRIQKYISCAIYLKHEAGVNANLGEKNMHGTEWSLTDSVQVNFQNIKLHNICIKYQTCQVNIMKSNLLKIAKN